MTRKSSILLMPLSVVLGVASLLWVNEVPALLVSSTPTDSQLISECITKKMMHVGDSTIRLDFDAQEFKVGETDICRWMTRAAVTVRSYFGRFPVPEVRLVLEPSYGSHVNGGTTYGDVDGEPRITVRLGRTADGDALIADWVMTHEMVHLSVPSVPDNSHWLEEGIATYVEPIARAQQGELTAERIWADMVAGMPKGLPRDGDLGLDHTPSWGRTYWGGALFCLEADVEIRRRTQNRLGLRDALRGVLAAGGSIRNDETTIKFLETADAALGISVLVPLYRQLGSAPGTHDLPRLWKDLGVVVSEDGVTFNDRAPLAPARRAITEP